MKEPAREEHPADGAPALDARGLYLAYPDGTPALHGLDLRVRAGERVGLVGPNGAGKSTFFLTACGVLAAQAGQVRLFGTPVHPRTFRPEIGLVMQSPDDQLFCSSVRHDVAFGPQNLGLPPDQVHARAEEALALTGTADLADRVPHHLSGGQRRMVSIAAVLALRPALVVYDEPTASLDLRARRRLVDFLRSSTHTQLVASHDLEFVLEVCDRVAVVDGGRVAADGEPCAVLGQDDLMRAHGLERPASLAPRPPAVEG